MNSEQAKTELYEAIMNLMPDLSRGFLLDIGDTLDLKDEPFYIKAWLDDREGWAVSVYNPGRIYTDAIGTMGTLVKSDDDGGYKVTGLAPNDDGELKPYTRIKFTIEDIDTIEPDESMINLKGDKLDDAYSPDS